MQREILIVFVITIGSFFSTIKASGSCHTTIPDTVDIRELTNRFLWDFYFTLGNNHDTLTGPRIVLETNVKLYPLIKNMIKFFRQKNELLGGILNRYDPWLYSDSFTVVIPDSFATQFKEARQIEAPNRIFPGCYYQLSPLIPSSTDGQYLFFRYSECYAGHQVFGYQVEYLDGEFSIRKQTKFEDSYSPNLFFQSYLDLALLRRGGIKEMPEVSHKDNESFFNAPPETEKAIEYKVDKLLCLISDHLYTYMEDGEKNYEVLPVINFLNHGNPRLNYMMNFLLKYLPDTLGRHVVYKWELSEKKACNDDRVFFLKKLPWDYDPAWAPYWLYAGQKNEFNVSVSDVYYTESGGINVLFDFYFPANFRRNYPQFYFLGFGYNPETQEFHIEKAEFLSGELRYFFWLDP